MNKPRKPKPTFNGLTFDSTEELEFYHWVVEGKANGLIENFTYPCESYELSSPVKLQEARFGRNGKQLKPKEVHVMAGHKYTPDFEVTFTTDGAELLGESLLSWTPKGKTRTAEKKIDFRFGLTITFDVKGTYSYQNMDRVLSLNTRWMMQTHGILVQKVVPSCLFLTSWVPELVRWTPKTKKLRTKYADTPTIKEYVR